ncbi:RNA polymerase III RPC4-domain-containing protein [Haematococcus lacustris]
MSGANEASGSGRGRGGTTRKGKFTPTVPGRRKKDESAAADGTGKQINNEAFKDLIKAAETEATWQRSARGRGRGAAGMGQQRYQVAFGGADSRPVLAAAKSRPAAGGSGGAGGGGSGAGGGGSNIKQEGGGQGGSGSGGGGPGAVGPGVQAPLAPSRPLHLQGKKEPLHVLDYEVYYPTVLPFQPPPDREEEYADFLELDEDSVAAAAAAAAAAAERRQPARRLPPDLGTQEDNSADQTAKDLRLLDAADPETLMLVQLPALLPVPMPSKPSSADVKDEGRLRQQPGAGSAGGAPEVSACALKDLPSGKLGKLLVFKSGKVKLQMGGVVMDVSPGLLCQHRQDAVAISCSSGDCVLLGQVARRMVISPDIWQLMEDADVPDWRREPWQPGVYHSDSQPAYESRPTVKTASHHSVIKEDPGAATATATAKSVTQLPAAEPGPVQSEILPSQPTANQAVKGSLSTGGGRGKDDVDTTGHADELEAVGEAPEDDLVNEDRERANEMDVDEDAMEHDY